MMPATKEVMEDTLSDSEVEQLFAGNCSISVTSKVLSASLELFTDNGYFRTTIPQISRRSNVSVGAIYHHFRDKQDIADRLFTQITDYMEMEFDKINEKHSGAIERCQSAILLLLRLTDKYPMMMRYMMTVRHAEFQKEGLTVCSSSAFKKMRGMVLEGIDHSEVRSLDPMVATSAAFGPTMRIITHSLDGQLQKSAVDYYDELCAVLTSVLKR